MHQFFVSLPSVAAVKEFVNAATKSRCRIDVRSDRYVVNGQSIMGLFSIDLAKPVQVEFHGNDQQVAQFKAEIAHLMDAE